MGWYKRSEVEKIAPDILAEWEAWLETNYDLGHYDAYKVRDQNVLPYIDGRPQWVVETYMPPKIEQKFEMKRKGIPE